MKSKVGSIVLVLFLLFLLAGLAGCTSNKELLKDTGIFGEHTLVRMENFGAVQGSISGGFFLGIGSVNGSLDSGPKLQFYWSPIPGEIIATALPYSKFRFIIDKAKEIPTVEFIFSNNWLNCTRDLDKSEKQEYLNSLNLNDLILSPYLKLARVRISTTTLEEEVYLPKAR